ncbi:MAG: hypothetical protein ACI8X5_001027 [Planctomycetota bacterium]
MLSRPDSYFIYLKEFSLVQGQLDTSVTDPLAAALLPVLVHRMNNTTQLVSNLHAIVQLGGDRNWLAERAGDLADSAADIGELGYLLAVLSSASGADMLLARRLPRGVAILLEALADVGRRSDRNLNLPASGLPDQASTIHSGWEFPWAFAALLEQVFMEQPAGNEFDWQLLREEEAWLLICPHVPEDNFDRLKPRLSALLPETKLDLRPGGWSWRIPADWLHVTTPDELR